MALLDESASGIYVIAATPFTDGGALDWPSTDRLIDFYLESGAAGITVLGVMGEAPKLARDEAEAFVGRVLRRTDGRVPVIVGVSNPGLSLLGDLARRSMDLGAAGVMVAAAAGVRTDEQAEAYFAAVAAELGDDIPVVVQDYPPLNGVYLSAPLIDRLFAEHASFKVLKHEEVPGLGKLSRLRGGERSGRRARRISILVGTGALYLPQELARGADGAMTGFAFPEMLATVCRRFRSGDRDGAEDLFDAYLPALRHEQQPGIGLALRKETLRRRGVIASAATRAPGPRLDAEDHAELSRII
jgi:4-hydroxy-tetrahydrodipicolinate synthase